MSDVVNPYQSPETIVAPVKPLVAQGVLTETMLMYLKGASPWLRFIGIMGFIVAGFTAIGSVSMLALIPIMGQIWQGIPGFEMFGSFFNTAISGTMIIFSIGGALVMFFPSLFTYRCGEKIRSYMKTGTEKELELALKNNKSIWKFYGIVCIVYLAFIPVVIIMTVIVGVATALF